MKPLPLFSRASLRTVFDICPFFIEHDENGNTHISGIGRAVCIGVIVAAIYGVFAVLGFIST